MSSLLPQKLQQLGAFSEEDVSSILEAAEERSAAKKEALLKPGEICGSLFFLEKGALYQYEMDDDLQKNVLDLHIAGDWVLNGQSFTQRQPSASFIMAFEESRLYEFKIEAIHKLIEQSSTMLQLGKILGVTNARLALFDRKRSPEEKYVYLMATKPDLFQYFPQHMIASFLKITPETLSRIRSRKLS